MSCLFEIRNVVLLIPVYNPYLVFFILPFLGFLRVGSPWGQTGSSWEILRRRPCPGFTPFLYSSNSCKRPRVSLASKKSFKGESWETSVQVGVWAPTELSSRFGSYIYTLKNSFGFRPASLKHSDSLRRHHLLFSQCWLKNFHEVIPLESCYVVCLIPV